MTPKLVLMFYILPIINKLSRLTNIRVQLMKLWYKCYIFFLFLHRELRPVSRIWCLSAEIRWPEWERKMFNWVTLTSASGRGSRARLLMSWRITWVTDRACGSPMMLRTSRVSLSIPGSLPVANPMLNARQTTWKFLSTRCLLSHQTKMIFHDKFTICSLFIKKIPWLKRAKYTESFKLFNRNF